MYNHGAKKSGTDTYYTPSWVREKLHLILGDNYLDPCPGHQQLHLRPQGVILGVGDGLTSDWGQYSHSFVNPPFSDMRSWIDKASLSADQGHKSLWFVKLDFRVSWYDSLENSADFIQPVKGYVRFEDDCGKPYPSATFQMCFAGWGLDKKLVRDIYGSRLAKAY
jgi:hypothetical protein